MTGDMPDPHKFGALLSAVHQKSISPNGKFGFHITTYVGNLPQAVEWEDSWEIFFAKSMRKALDLEIERKGPSEELNVFSETIFRKVIPRLLRPLQSEGRTVKPSLVHGDLWYANTGTDVDTNQSLVFDACCFYAHNECTSNFPSCIVIKQDHSWTNNLKIKTSLGNGDLRVIGLVPSTSMHTTLLSRSRLPKRTLKAA